jgi:Ca-activated chloride channel homolog
MAQVSHKSNPRRLRALVPAAVSALALAALCWLPAASAARRQDARPRRAGQSVAAPQQPTPRPAQTPAPSTRQQQQPAPRATPAAPQQQQPPASPSPSPADAQQPQGEEIDPEEIIRVDTNLVNLNVRVIDRNNRPVGDVPKEEFRVYEDGVLQEITFFSRAEVPVSYGLVVDNSGSLRTQLQTVIDSAKTIVNSNRPGDEAFVVRFIDSEKIEELQDFTADNDALIEALDRMYIDGGQTAVVDAVMLTAEKLAGYKKGDALGDRRRRALILVTDGEDRSSVYKQEDLFDRLREEAVQIYVIGFTNELSADGNLIRKSPKEKAVKLINRLATETGGRAFFPTSLAELPAIADEITKDLRTQYVLGYYPTNKARDGSFRQIRVQIADAGKRDKRIALTRAGRVASPEGARPQPPPAPAPKGNSATKRP